MEAVFPPREDVQPGDIVLVCKAESVQKGKPVPISVLLARLYDTPAAIGNHLGLSMELPSNKGVAAGEMATEPGLFAEKPIVRGDPSKARSPATRLRNVALPDVIQVALSKEELTALIPAGVALGNVSIGAEQFDSGSISVPSAAEYGLPLMPLMKLMVRDKETIDDALKAAALVGPGACGGANLYVVKIIQDVIVANTIRVTMASKRTFDAGAQVGYTLPADSTVKQTFATVLAAWKGGADSKKGTDGTSDADDAKDGGTGDDVPAKAQAAAPKTVDKAKTAKSATAKAEASKPKAAASSPKAAADKPSPSDIDTLSQALVDSLKTVAPSSGTTATDALPNVKTRISVGRAGSITMDRTFVHPVVVGFRSIRIVGSEGDDGTVYLTAGPKANAPDTPLSVKHKIEGFEPPPSPNK
ncbi:hypothetical protein GCM10007350_10970 [Jeongeupia chitinilytica]|uniref:Uncharacterized protein n=2 Tax=Jeongeupia chitinilytica TaxID=1041641 RepID=A0ABQ3H0A2_9NEIS|nr:hypothetical protein GCM10007350_10970 [Jeongeupia chitinilytica]